MKGAVIGIAGCSQDGIAAVGDTLIGALALEGYFAILSTQNDEPTIGGGASCRIRLGATPCSIPGVFSTWPWSSTGKSSCRKAANWPWGPRPWLSTTGRPDREQTGCPREWPAPRPSCPFQSQKWRSEAEGVRWQRIVSSSASLHRGSAFRRDGYSLGSPAEIDQRRETAHTAVKAAFSAGVDFAAQHPLPRNLRLGARQARGVGRRIADGNEMCARAALFAGCKFFAAYPIAPAGGITDFLQREIWRHGGSFLAAEDEIAAAAAAVGASFAGVKSMTATSGPGLSLQAEVLGLTSAVELPLVCINVQRGGPPRACPRHRNRRTCLPRFSRRTATMSARCWPRPVSPTRSMSRSRRSISPSTTKPP